MIITSLDLVEHFITGWIFEKLKVSQTIIIIQTIRVFVESVSVSGEMYKKHNHPVFITFDDLQL